MIPLASDLLPFPDQMRREGHLKFAGPPDRLSSSGRTCIVGTISRDCREVYPVSVDKTWNADRLVLSMHHAQEVDEHSAPELVAIVRELAQRAGLPMPRVYLMDSPQPNAFATGRNPQHAAVCATTGLLNTLSRDEIAGVIGHELGHVRSHDTLTMTITATIAGAISMLAQFAMFFRGGNRDSNSGLGIVGSVLMLILAPLAAMIVQMAISRTREYAADNLGARISGRPMRSPLRSSKSRA